MRQLEARLSGDCENSANGVSIGIKAVTGRLLKCFDSEQIKREIDEELRFHLDLLTEALQHQDMSLAEARDAAQKRFGNVEQIKDQCVEISRRNHPSIRALKSFLILVFLVGVLVRIFSPEFHLTRVGDILIVVGVLGRLLLYVRSLTPSSFLSKPETSSPLMLNEDGRASIEAYDQTKRTPVERLISDK